MCHYRGYGCEHLLFTGDFKSIVEFAEKRGALDPFDHFRMNPTAYSNILATCSGQAERNIISVGWKCCIALVNKGIFFPSAGQRQCPDPVNGTGILRCQLFVYFIGIDTYLISGLGKAFYQGEHVGLHAAAIGKLVMDNSYFHSRI